MNGALTVLYHHKDDEISITVEAGFENGSLVVKKGMISECV